MLSEQRHAMILKILEERRSITVAELTELLGISESTARRDITVLDKAGRLVKVFGGAVMPDNVYISAEPTVAQKKEINREEKRRIARYAASLIQPQRLAASGIRVILVGGTLKSSTEAVVGTMAALTLKDYHFTKGFFGTNGINPHAGFTTPDDREALVKKTAVEQCQKAYIVSDNSKFNRVSSVTFAGMSAGTILTDACPEEWKGMADIVLCP